MFTEHNTNGQYTGKQIERMNTLLIALYPLADSPDDFEYDEQLVKHYSERVRDELTSNTEKRHDMKPTRYCVIDRLTGAVVYRTKPDEPQTAHNRAERWCRRNLGDRGKIQPLS